MDQRQRKRRRGRKQSKRRRVRNLIIKLTLFSILVIGILAAVILWKKYGPSNEKANLNEYYGIKTENQLAIIVDDEVVEPNAMIADGKAYVEYGIVRDYINDRFYWDPNENVLLYALPADVISVGVGSKEYSISKQKESIDYVILKAEGSTAYIALDFVKQYTNMDFEVFDNPGRVVIDKKTGDVQVAKTKRDAKVRKLGGFKSPVLTEVKKNTDVRVIDEAGSWRKVRTEDGFIGYVHKSSIKGMKTETITRDFEEPEFTSLTRDHKINMAWFNVVSAESNSVMLEMIAQTKGLNVISPTWFFVSDTAGNMSSIASADYVNYAHQAGLEVWAAVRDFDGGINSFDESYELLSRTSSRDTLINQLIASVIQNGIDGINVDFEKISVECGEHYIEFIRELSVKCKMNNIVLSVDNYVPQAYNQQYHREEQALFADYVVIMGYDEHYGGSLEAGSVSSYNFVLSGVEETLKDVPAEKVISGIPFFTRIWKKTPKTDAELASQAGTEEGQYTMNVESMAYSMDEARSIVDQNGAAIIWDEATKQNYATWEADGATYEVWLEDAASLEPKLQLIPTYELAGSAAWRLGQDSAGIWDLILQYVN